MSLPRVRWAIVCNTQTAKAQNNDNSQKIVHQILKVEGSRQVRTIISWI